MASYLSPKAARRIVAAIASRNNRTRKLDHITRNRHRSPTTRCIQPSRYDCGMTARNQHVINPQFGRTSQIIARPEHAHKSARFHLRNDIARIRQIATSKRSVLRHTASSIKHARARLVQSHSHFSRCVISPIQQLRPTAAVCFARLGRNLRPCCQQRTPQSRHNTQLRKHYSAESQHSSRCPISRECSARLRSGAQSARQQAPFSSQDVCPI